MLHQLVAAEHPEFLTTYTRNPRIVQMPARVSSSIYPLHQDAQLAKLASNQPHATAIDAATYHVGRYGEQGLFSGEDPASKPLAAYDIALKQQFTELEDVRNALVVVARTRRDI